MMKVSRLLFTAVGGVILCLLLTTLPGRLAAASPENAPGAQTDEPLPDLMVDQIVLNPPSPEEEDRISIRPVIKNIGNAAAPGFTIHLYVDPVDYPPTPTTPATNHTFFGPGLAAGGTFDGYSISNVLIARPDWRICAWVDVGNSIAESNEENNLLCISSPLAGTPDEYEPDNVCEDAKELQKNPPPQQRNLYRAGGVADVDWVKFTAKSGGVYQVEAIPASEGLNLYVELHNSCDSPPSFGAGVNVKFTAPADGTYYLKIGSVDPDYGPESDYTLALKAEEGCTLLLEPNDLCTLPSQISVNTGPQAYSFCSPGDVDWSRFEVRAGAVYTVTATSLGSQVDVQLSRYNSCTEEAVESGQVMHFTASAPGFVYLKSQNHDPNVSGAGTDYTIEVAGSGGCEMDRLEPDNTQAQAQPMSIDGNPQRHNICPAGDVDWVKFTAASGMTYTVETLNLGPDADTVLCQYSAAGQQIRCDDNSGAGLASRLVITDSVAGDYFFKIRDYDPEVAGARVRYDVQVITGPCKKDAFEPNDSLATARAIPTNGAEQMHNICPAGDQDWVKFEATANTSYVISATAIGPASDPEIMLYDAAGNLLAHNDDYSPGTSARIVHHFNEAGTYFVKAQHFNPAQYGAGTEYSISIRPGTVTQTPSSPSPPPPGAAQPEAAATGVRTLILVNRARMVELFGETNTAALMSKLETLARHEDVHGEIIRLDHNTSISAAFASWIADLTSVDKANHVTTEIRRMIMTYLSEREGIRYVVLVGDDRALPFRRVLDLTTQQPEETYTDVDPAHPTGAALRANYYLTDDYFVDRAPTPHKDREIYLPDLAIGRLIETPADMIGFIDHFLENSITTVENVLVTGYDFVQETAHAECEDWQRALANMNKVACLIGPSWSKSQFQNLQFRESPPFKVQSINGHAVHFAQGIAAGGEVSAAEVLAANMDLSGGLIYTVGCHAGLNVPATNSIGPLDLPEAFVRKGANYIGNSGYGWGLLNGIGLSEKVIRLFTQELHRETEVAMGEAFMRAKNRYYEQEPALSVFGEKVVQQLIFYGLPMYRIRGVVAAFSGDFPGVEFKFDQSGTFSDGAFSRPLNINFNRILDPADPIGNLNTFSTESGQYLSLFDSVSADVGEPVQPLHFGNITVPDVTARAAILRSATISQTIPDFNPLVGTPVNEYVPRSPADVAPLNAVGGWHPPLPTGVRASNGRSTLVTQLGQYNIDQDELRLFSDFSLDVYFSASSDHTPPEILVVDGLYEPSTREVHVKVGVVDEYGIREVIAAYIEDDRIAPTSVQSVNLAFDESSQKWRGSFPGDEHSLFFIQAIDNAGNMATAVNKGRYYRPVQARETSANILHLPLIAR